MLKFVIALSVTVKINFAKIIVFKNTILKNDYSSCTSRYGSSQNYVDGNHRTIWNHKTTWMGITELYGITKLRGWESQNYGDGITDLCGITGNHRFMWTKSQNYVSGTHRTMRMGIIEL